VVIGRVHGRPIVAYESVEEAIKSRSCIACDNFSMDYICPLYARCRAELLSYEKPRAFVQKEENLIEKEFIGIRDIEILWQM